MVRVTQHGSLMNGAIRIFSNEILAKISTGTGWEFADAPEYCEQLMGQVHAGHSAVPLVVLVRSLETWSKHSRVRSKLTIWREETLSAMCVATVAQRGDLL